MTQFFKIHTHKQQKDQKETHKHVANNDLRVAGLWVIISIIFILLYISSNFHSEQVLILLLRNYGKGNGGGKKHKLLTKKFKYPL